MAICIVCGAYIFTPYQLILTHDQLKPFEENSYPKDDRLVRYSICESHYEVVWKHSSEIGIAIAKRIKEIEERKQCCT